MSGEIKYYKLIDYDGYVNESPMNRKLLAAHAKAVNGEYYYIGSGLGVSLKSENGAYLCDHNEFQFFEKVERIPEPKEKSDLNVSSQEPTEISSDGNERPKEAAPLNKRVYDLCKRYSLIYVAYPADENYLITYMELEYDIDSVKKCRDLERMIVLDRSLRGI